MTNRPGFLFAFEGIDGAGKTTQALKLQEFVFSLGRTAIYTKEPTEGPHGQRIRQSFTTGRMEPQAELATFESDRREHAQQVLRPQLALGHVVICDRYFLSSAAYQGAAGLDPETIVARSEAFAPIPDAIFYLDVDPDVGLRRIDTRGHGTNLFERREVLEAAAGIFRAIKRPYLIVLDGRQTIEAVADDVRACARAMISDTWKNNRALVDRATAVGHDERLTWAQRLDAFRDLLSTI